MNKLFVHGLALPSTSSVCFPTGRISRDNFAQLKINMGPLALAVTERFHLCNGNVASNHGLVSAFFHCFYAKHIAAMVLRLVRW